MSNKQKMYFSYIGKVMSSKNKLEKDVHQLVREFNRQVISAEELPNLVERFKIEVDKLQAKHPRCKPLNWHFDKPTAEHIDGSLYDADLFSLRFYEVRPKRNEAELTEALRRLAL